MDHRVGAAESSPDPRAGDEQALRHLAFGGGVHYCVGAPLARIEVHIALNALARRLVSPRLVTAPPPYRPNTALRGPEHLLVRFDRLLEGSRD